MNVDADILAKQFWQHLEQDQEKLIREGVPIPSTQVALIIDGKQIMSHYVHKIWAFIQGKKHQKYLQEKHKQVDRQHLE